jgi:tetratricopeptide (TPR) repeat protein
MSLPCPCGAIYADHTKPISKRRIALLRSTGKVSEAISALVDFLQAFPTDGEAWAELSDLYVSIGAYQQSIFALEEVLLITPNAWNVGAPRCSVVTLANDLRSTPG